MKDKKRQDLVGWFRRQIARGKLLLEVTHVNKIPLYSASACYFMVLAAFPLLVLVLSILRYTPLQVETLIELVDGLVPAALMPWIKHLIHSTYENSSAAILSVSAVVALWSASRSVYGLVMGLNTIYGVKESRNYFQLRGMNMFYMFLFLVVLVLTLVIHVFGKAIVAMLNVPEYPFFSA